MQDNHAILELLNAKEGEQVQFKEAKFPPLMSV